MMFSMHSLLSLFLDLWLVNRVGYWLLKHGTSFPNACTLTSIAVGKVSLLVESFFFWHQPFILSIYVSCHAWSICALFKPSIIINCPWLAVPRQSFGSIIYALQQVALGHGSSYLWGALCKWEHFKMLVCSEPKADRVIAILLWMDCWEVQMSDQERA